MDQHNTRICQERQGVYPDSVSAYLWVNAAGVVGRKSLDCLYFLEIALYISDMLATLGYSLDEVV